MLDLAWMSVACDTRAVIIEEYRLAPLDQWKDDNVVTTRWITPIDSAVVLIDKHVDDPFTDPWHNNCMHYVQVLSGTWRPYV